jgi:phosphoribosylformylglycinamidine cyclo-ligase
MSEGSPMVMLEDRATMVPTTYEAAGVDTAEADAGLRNIVERIKATWPPKGTLGEVKLSIGYFANVIDIGGIGLGFCTDGVGSKAIIAQMMSKYDTIGIDCVAMNVNDLICVGARPISMVDYIAIQNADSKVLDGIGIGLTIGAKEAEISISGGETAQLRDVVNGFDLAGTAIGIVQLDRIIVGRDLVPGDIVIGIESSGIHSNGLSLAREVFFERAHLSPHHVFPELSRSLGAELLHPTLIYVREIMDVIEHISKVKALVNITSDGLLNLPRVYNDEVGFLIDNMPQEPAIFTLIERCGAVDRTVMFEVYNMGIGFCVVVGPENVSAVLAILERHGRRAQVIGRVIPDRNREVHLPKEKLVGQGKKFRRV